MAKIVVTAALLLLFIAFPAFSGPVWLPGAVVTNPSTNQVLVTTGVLAAGQYSVGVYTYSDVGVPALLQRVSTGAVVRESIVIPPSASFILFMAPYPLNINNGETIRVIARSGTTAEVQAVLFLVTP